MVGVGVSSALQCGVVVVNSTIRESLFHINPLLAGLGAVLAGFVDPCGWLGLGVTVRLQCGYSCGGVGVNGTCHRRRQLSNHVPQPCQVTVLSHMDSFHGLRVGVGVGVNNALPCGGAGVNGAL